MLVYQRGIYKVVPQFGIAKMVQMFVQFHYGFCWWYIELVNGDYNL